MTGSNLENEKEGQRNSCLSFLFNLHFHGARFVLVEVEIIYEIFTLPGDKEKGALAAAH